MANDQGKRLEWQVLEGQSLDQVRRALAKMPYLRHESTSWSSEQLQQVLDKRIKSAPALGFLEGKALQTDHPYNTYTRLGLPPTPIAMPGEASLLASIRPSAEQSLYFVARGDGSSEFSLTLAQHNDAVDRFIRKRAP
ncbi:MAG: hypothetical protein EBX28_02930 [Betaproteobacteria bacterium]|nr:hypothetical protein [Betaproteobacteria bacterium]